MEKQFEAAITLIKEMDIKGCITGSSLLGYFPDEEYIQDIDIFVYDMPSFTKALYYFHYHAMFEITDSLELWKFKQSTDKENKSYSKKGLVNTIKFTYNTCIPINIIFKKESTDIFSVLSSFDMDIVCKAYDIQTKQILDLSENKGTKIATWNKWNTAFYSGEVWQISRILRQLERCFKYHKRGYNTNSVVLKYIELIDQLQAFVNIFNSESYSEKLKLTKKNTKVVRQLCKTWLETHQITDEDILLIKTKIKEI